MAYRTDIGLDFLQHLTNQELEQLFNILVFDEKNEKRLNEQITNSAEYIRHQTNYSKYWKIIAEELQTFGGNTIVNLVRRKGVTYKEILFDVCDELKIKYDKKASIVINEFYLLSQTASKIIDKMSLEERQEFVKATGLKTTTFDAENVKTAFEYMIKEGGFKAYVASLLSANSYSTLFSGKVIGGTVALVTLSRVIPVVNTVALAWTAINITGAAYRVTIPAVLFIAAIRLKYKNEDISYIG